LVVLAGKAKVDHLQVCLFDGLFRREQEVLGLQIPMADVVLMHVENCSEHVLHDNGRLHFGKVSRIDDAIKKFASCA